MSAPTRLLEAISRRHAAHPRIIGLALAMFPAVVLPVRGQTNIPWAAGWTNLAEFVASLGATLTASGPTSPVVVQADGRTLQFIPDSRRLLCDGVLVWMHAPLVSQGGARWFLSRPDARAVVLPLLAPQHLVSSSAVTTVVLDPGHGGADVGAVTASGLREKDLTLDLAKRVRKHLRPTGLRVIMTRTRDKTLPLADRVRMAQRHRADLFISLHFNAGASPTAAGMETYALPCAGAPSTSGTNSDGTAVAGNAFDASNTLLAFEVHKAMISRLQGEDRGLRRARFEVLKLASCPAALIECGFLTNPDEARRIASPAHRDAMARAVAEGIERYRQLTSSAPRPP